MDPFVTCLYLAAQSDPTVHINMAFLGQQLHYRGPAWWTTPLPLQRWRPNMVSRGKMGRWEGQGYGISRMIKQREGIWKSEWRMSVWEVRGKRGDQINHRLADNWTSCTQGRIAAPWKVTPWFAINCKRWNGDFVPFGFLPGILYLTRCLL